MIAHASNRTELNRKRTPKRSRVHVFRSWFGIYRRNLTTYERTRANDQSSQSRWVWWRFGQCWTLQATSVPHVLHHQIRHFISTASRVTCARLPYPDTHPHTHKQTQTHLQRHQRSDQRHAAGFHHSMTLLSWSSCESEQRNEASEMTLAGDREWANFVCVGMHQFNKFKITRRRRRWWWRRRRRHRLRKKDFGKFTERRRIRNRIRPLTNHLLASLWSALTYCTTCVMMCLHEMSVCMMCRLASGKRERDWESAIYMYAMHESYMMLAILLLIVPFHTVSMSFDRNKRTLWDWCNNVLCNLFIWKLLNWWYHFAECIFLGTWQANLIKPYMHIDAIYLRLCGHIFDSFKVYV